MNREFVQISSKKQLKFSKWTRKSYAVFNSLKKIIKISCLMVAYTIISFPQKTQAQNDTIYINKTIDIEEVEIIGQLGQGIVQEVGRMITVISKDDIECAPNTSIQDLLEYSLNIDARQRGARGVQTDLSIRGGSFDHVLILLNGINITDAQTGHLSMDLPVDIEDVEKIEILNGPAARVYGPNAFTGVINIVTQPKGKREMSIIATVGDYGYKKTNFSLNIPVNKTKNFIAYSFSDADGYTDNTDFYIHNVFFHSNLNISNNNIDLNFGYNQKSFGANGFYTPRFPEQFEKGKTILASVKYNSSAKFKANISWRRKHDNFILIKSNPSVYQNFHITDNFDININYSIFSDFGISTLGFVFRSDNILSNNLGLDNPRPVLIHGHDSLYYNKKYSRSNHSFFLEHNMNIGHLFISAGTMANWNSDYQQEIQLFPGVDLQYKFNSYFTIFGSFQRSQTLPTFTDLFYSGPTNIGNDNLKPNTLVSGEIGMKWKKNNIFAQVSYYSSKGKNIVDWLWNTPNNTFSPINLKEFYAQGLEVMAILKLPTYITNKCHVKSISVNYAYNDVDKSVSDTVSKYYNLKHKLNFNLDHKIVSNLYASWNLQYNNRIGEYILYDFEASNYFFTNYKPIWLLDGKIYWQAKSYQIYLSATNLFDVKYVDIGSIQQPGRWIFGGIKVKFGL